MRRDVYTCDDCVKDGLTKEDINPIHLVNQKATLHLCEKCFDKHFPDFADLMPKTSQTKNETKN